jgi:hypothetical protein
MKRPHINGPHEGTTAAAASFSSQTLRRMKTNRVKGQASGNLVCTFSALPRLQSAAAHWITVADATDL